MAPEQAAGDPVDHRADLYALGVLAYEMLAGRPPFEGRSVRALMAAHMMTPPDLLSAHRPDVPVSLEAVVMQCLEKEPDYRPASAARIVATLEEILRAPGPRLPRERRTSSKIRRGRRLLRQSNARDDGARWSHSAPAWRCSFLLWLRRLPSTGAISRRFRRIAVATFRDASSDGSLTRLSRSIVQTSRASRRADSASVVGARRLNRLRQQLAGPRQTSVLAVRVRAEYVVSGEVAPLGGDSVRIGVRIVAARNGETIRQLTETRRRAVRRGRHCRSCDRASRVGSSCSPAPHSAQHVAGRRPTVVDGGARGCEGLQLEAALRSPDPTEDESFAELTRFDRAFLPIPSFCRRASGSRVRHLAFGGEVGHSALVLVEAQQDRLTTYEHALLDALRADAGGNHELSLRSWRLARQLAPSWPNTWWLAMKLRDTNRPRKHVSPSIH